MSKKKFTVNFFITGQAGTRDVIKFDLSDGTNKLIDRYFFITVAEMDITHPFVYNKGITLEEGSRVTLTSGRYDFYKSSIITFKKICN